MMLIYMDDVKSKIIRSITTGDGGVIISGPKGVGKYSLAECLSQEILGRTAETHPDFVCIAPLPDEKAIKTEQIEELHNILQYRPGLAKKRIVVIDDADTLTVSAQNSLLKVLEESDDYNLFILINHNSLLPTIHSRLQEFKVPVLSKHKMTTYLIGEGILPEDIPFMLSISCGRIGRYKKIASETDLLALFKNVYKCLTTSGTQDKSSLLKFFHCLKEKDKDSFFELYDSNIVNAMFDFMDYIFTEYVKQVHNAGTEICFSIEYDYPSVINLLQLIQEQGEFLKRNQYTGADFFNFIRHVSAYRFS